MKITWGIIIPRKALLEDTRSRSSSQGANKREKKGAIGWKRVERERDAKVGV
jgi:hypothetical protein